MASSDLTPASAFGEGSSFGYQDEEDLGKQFLSALRRLAQLSDDTFSADQGIAYHSDPPNKISLPHGMTPAKGSTVLADVATALAQKENFTRTFKYRPWDGANAVTQVMRQFFGTSGRGVPIKTMFGSIPPQQLEIEIGPSKTTQVPWGNIAFEHLEGTLMLGSASDEEYGTLFQLTINCPKRFGAEVMGLFNLIDAYLREHSIYKGKSIKGTDNPKFLDLQENPTVVYSDDVTAALTNSIWGILEHSELFLADGRKVNRRVLLHGPYGTGKSEAGAKTAAVANKNGWTFINFHSGKSTLDELEATIATARLYSPSVVFIEDIDVYASKEGENYQSRLSNLFDGIGSKGDKVMIVMTSNHAASFSKGMLRAGRVDRMIEIGSLDRNATEQLIRKVIGQHRLDESIDFDAVWKAMSGFEPAFVRQTFDQAAEAALIRTGSRDYTLDTADFVGAAHLLRPQHEMHTSIADTRKVKTFDSYMMELVENVMTERLDVRLPNGGQLVFTGKPTEQD